MPTWARWSTPTTAGGKCPNLPSPCGNLWSSLSLKALLPFCHPVSSCPGSGPISPFVPYTNLVNLCQIFFFLACEPVPNAENSEFMLDVLMFNLVWMIYGVNVFLLQQKKTVLHGHTFKFLQIFKLYFQYVKGTTGSIHIHYYWINNKPLWNVCF